MQMLALWRNKDATLNNAGPYSIFVEQPRPLTYYAGEPHWVSWNDFWISATPFASQADALDAIARFEQGRR